MKNLWIPAILLLLVFLNCSCDKEEPEDVPERPEILNNLVSKIENNEYGGEVHSLLIMKDDRIIVEEYFNGYSKKRRHELFSVTKSFTSALIGICIQKGYIENVNAKVLDFFPEYKGKIANYDTLKAKITLADLLTMRAGFEWNEWSVPYSSSLNINYLMLDSKDRIKFVLDRPMAYAPGTHFAYNSGVSNVLSAIITKATGKSAKAFAAENLFKPLGITDYDWDNLASNVSIGGWGLSMRPIDMVKFGQLFLHKGKWNNVQVISESWVELSVQPHCRIDGFCDYGYQWWRYGEDVVKGGILPSSDIYFASGSEEQYIWVLPSYNAVVVCTAGNEKGAFLKGVLWEYVIKALEQMDNI